MAPDELAAVAARNARTLEVDAAHPTGGAPCTEADAAREQQRQQSERERMARLWNRPEDYAAKMRTVAQWTPADQQARAQWDPPVKRRRPNATRPHVRHGTVRVRRPRAAATRSSARSGDSPDEPEPHLAHRPGRRPA